MPWQPKSAKKYHVGGGPLNRTPGVSPNLMDAIQCSPPSLSELKLLLNGLLNNTLSQIHVRFSATA